MAVCTGGGTSASTTTSVLLAATMPSGRPTLVAECDVTGGDVAAWAQLAVSPSWASAVAGADRSWAALIRHAQALPSGLRVITTPPRSSQARSAVLEAARTGFADLLSAMPDVVTVADCGRVAFDVPAWAPKAQLTLLLIRQATASGYANVALTDRTIEAIDLLRPVCQRIGVVLIGSSPYRPNDVEDALGVPLFGVLPEDRGGAELVAGGWTAGRRADRSPLGRAARVLAERVLETLSARGVAADV